MVKGELTRLLDMVKERRQGENIDWALVGTYGQDQSNTNVKIVIHVQVK